LYRLRVGTPHLRPQLDKTCRDLGEVALLFLTLAHTLDCLGDSFLDSMFRAALPCPTILTHEYTIGGR